MGLKPSLYWNLEDDKENIREGAIELRAHVAEHMYYKNYETPEKAKQQLNGPGFTWCIAAARKVELITVRKLSGRIIEVSAGTGVFSAQTFFFIVLELFRKEKDELCAGKAILLMN